MALVKCGSADADVERIKCKGILGTLSVNVMGRVRGRVKFWGVRVSIRVRVSGGTASTLIDNM